MKTNPYNSAAYKRARREVRNALAAGRPYLCAICHARPAVTVDHKIQLADGGTNEPANLRPACGPCNYGRRGREQTRHIAAW